MAAAAAAASAPSSLRVSRQGTIGGGQVLYSRSQRAATVSARASMNITCCANQTQTAQRKSYSGTTSPPSGSVKEKVKPRLDDGGVGFPPFRFGGGGGGGGGGSSSSSGGFILFVVVLLLDYLKEFERNLQNGPRRSGGGYDDGLAPQ